MGTGGIASLGRERRHALVVIGAIVIAVSVVVVVVHPYRSDRGAQSFSKPGVVDIGFSQAMSVHHQQAVTMSDIIVQAPGVSPEVKDLAGSIAAAQLQQIGTMQGWLELWEQPPVPRGDEMLWMEPAMARNPSMEMAATPMPGLASQAEVNRLAKLQGGAAGVLFLQLMIRHHQGGLQMANFAAAHAAVPQVRALAGEMALDQSQEISLMRSLLALYHAAPLPFQG